MKDTLPPLPISPNRNNLPSSSSSSSSSSSPPTTSTSNFPNPNPSALVRRHHTLSTSAASRLVSSERREARAALNSPNVNLSATDVEYYVPQSPVDPPASAWSDIGHGNATATAAIPTKASNTHRHVRGVSMGGSSTSPFDESVDLHSNPLSTSSPSFQTILPPSPSNPASRGSSFVVLRGARGDAALTERRTVVSDPRRLSGAPSTSSTRNSLTSFVEADSEVLGNEGDERTQEEIVFVKEERTSPPLSTPTFRLPARAKTFGHTRSISSVTTSDAWNSSEPPSALRRPQSLNFHRNPPRASSDSWRTHDRGVSEDVSTYLGRSVPASRSPVPYSEPSTPYNGGGGSTSLKHSTSYSSQHSNSRHTPTGGSTSLSHSNSYGSHHSVNGIGGGGPLSPVAGFVRSPWSPTREETQALALGVSGSPPKSSGRILNREGSSSSRESGKQLIDKEDDGNEMEVSELISRPSLKMGSITRNSRTILNSSNALRSVTSSSPSPSRRLPPLVTDPNQLTASTSLSSSTKKSKRNNRHGPASASPFVPPIGHSHSQFQQPTPHPSGHPFFHQSYVSSTNKIKGKFTAVSGSNSEWSKQKDFLTGGSNSKSSSSFSTTPTSTSGSHWPPSGGFGVGLAIQQQQQIQVLQNQMMVAMEAMENMKLNAASGGINQQHPLPHPSSPYINNENGEMAGGVYQGDDGMSIPQEEAPIDVSRLIGEKGYNPIMFDLKPLNARFFVIKSYTEEDVHKSLKHEIWASTDLGNKRLDKAFKENFDKGPIFLFFSVNGSGHFAGVARMTSAVDYTTSSTVWASDKWKGIFQVQWIYIKDVPLASLRHIRLSNTPENKPVTSSRDTQEVPYEAGCEILRILSTYLSRTSLLQDFAWYEARKDEDPTATASTTATAAPSTVASPLVVPNQQLHNSRPSSALSFRSGGAGGSFLAQPFQQSNPQQQQQYYNQTSAISHINYQQQRSSHQAHFVPPPFQPVQLEPQLLPFSNPYQFNPLVMQQQQQIFLQQQQQYQQQQMNYRKFSRS